MIYVKTSTVGDIETRYDIVENERVKSECKHKIYSDWFCDFSYDYSISNGSVF
jgi:hypothetical protein